MKSNILFLVISICLAAVVIYFPVLFVGASVTTTDSISIPQGEIIVRTLLWSIGVGLISTIIGFPIGLRLSSVKPNFRIGIIVGLLITLAIPAYACFYAWWQLWPAGTWLHSYFVKNSLVEFATKTSVVLALVGWSLPIPALISYMSSSSNTSLSVLNKLDGLSLRKRFIQRVHVDKYVITASIMLVATITAVNTTCFDLSQIHTIGNELRAVIAVGGTVFDVPYLSFIALSHCYIPSVSFLN